MVYMLKLKIDELHCGRERSSLSIIDETQMKYERFGPRAIGEDQWA